MQVEKLVLLYKIRLRFGHILRQCARYKSTYYNALIDIMGTLRLILNYPHQSIQICSLRIGVSFINSI